MRVVRPVVRSFKKKFIAEAARWVQRGGHAIVWEEPRRGLLVFRKPKDGDEMDLGAWAVLDLGKQKWAVSERGALKGLAFSLVPRQHNDIVDRWIERDSMWPGPTRTVDFDCLECGACCRDNEVVLHDVDVKRFKDGGRADLLKAPFSRRRDGKLVLTLLRSKDCRHLAKDNKCGIYALRPDACSEFPVASECCLYAREEEMKVYDGVAPGG